MQLNRRVLILRSIYEDNNITQRGLCGCTGFALGTVNSAIRDCVGDGLITQADSGYQLTEQGYDYLKPYRVDRALIMAAGFGSRFVPLSFETPKGLLEVFGEPMVERQIKQLKSAGVNDIAIVVGYMKERFDYLTDKYGAKLIYNPDYETKNNIASINAAYDYLKGKNAYILSSDNWIRRNMYHRYEAAAWYSARHSDGRTAEWTLVTDKKGHITDTYPGGCDCDYMYGPAYFSRKFSDALLPVLRLYCSLPGTDDYYWEHVLMEMLNGTAKKRLTAYFGHIPEAEPDIRGLMYINRQPEDNVYEFENLEELRRFDPKYEDDSGSPAMQLVSRVFGVPESEIVRIRRLKAGMTNNSWLFEVHGKQYICRIPGEGTEVLINRREEKAVYDAVEPLGITEKVIFFEPETGYKISEYYEGSRNADPKNAADMDACMRKLRALHESGVRVEHHFDIDKKIDYYIGLVGDVMFGDFAAMDQRRHELVAWLCENRFPEVLSHIDSVADNFIFLDGADVSEDVRDLSRIRLIDWEYAGMCDPMIDIGMCAIYSYMDETGAMRLMRSYFGREPSEREKLLVYAYMALGGMLWSLWGLYKEKLGVQFSDYTIRMYRYFKKYSAYVLKNTIQHFA